MRKHVFVKVLLVCLLVGLLAASAYAETLKIKVTNKTDATISFAFAEGQVDSGGEDIPDKSRGWMNIKAGETKTRSYEINTGFCAPYYYADSKGGKRVWGGKSGDRAFWIHPTDSFNVVGKKIPGGKRVPFRELDYEYDDRTGECTATLNFTAK